MTFVDMTKQDQDFEKELCALPWVESVEVLRPRVWDERQYPPAFKVRVGVLRFSGFGPDLLIQRNENEFQCNYCELRDGGLRNPHYRPPTRPSPTEILKCFVGDEVRRVFPLVFRGLKYEGDPDNGMYLQLVGAAYRFRVSSGILSVWCDVFELLSSMKEGEKVATAKRGLGKRDVVLADCIQQLPEKNVPEAALRWAAFVLAFYEGKTDVVGPL